MLASAAPALIVLFCVIGADVWVYTDAKQRLERRNPVVFSTRLITLETPREWAIACLVLFVVVLPLYLTTRRQIT